MDNNSRVLERAFLQRIFIFVVDTFHWTDTEQFPTKSCFLSKFTKSKLVSFLGLEPLTVSFTNNDQFSKRILFIQVKKQNLKENLCPFRKSQM